MTASSRSRSTTSGSSVPAPVDLTRRGRRDGPREPPSRDRRPRPHLPTRQRSACPGGRAMRQRRLGRLGLVGSTAVLGLFLAVTPTLACGGLIGPNGAVNLLRTTTLAGYHDGVEHYVTAFQFAGGGGAFGSITPLPGVPTSVVKGGDWTLQRLVRETSPVEDVPLRAAAVPAAS